MSVHEQLSLAGVWPRGFAEFSACGRFRYALGRAWGPGPRDLWMLLNPSSAGAAYDDNDPTARKVIGFSRRLGAGSAVIVNPNALIETHPKKLCEARARGEDVRGPDNHRVIRTQVALADRVIVGWGGGIDSDDRARALTLLAGRTLWCLGRTEDGEPRHPLMLAYATPLERWSPEGR